MLRRLPPRSFVGRPDLNRWSWRPPEYSSRKRRPSNGQTVAGGGGQSEGRRFEARDTDAEGGRDGAATGDTIKRRVTEGMSKPRRL